METLSSILAWEIPWTEKPGRLQSMGPHRGGHDWVHAHAPTLSKHFNDFYRCTHPTRRCTHFANVHSPLTLIRIQKISSVVLDLDCEFQFSFQEFWMLVIKYRHCWKLYDLTVKSILLKTKYTWSLFPSYLLCLILCFWSYSYVFYLSGCSPVS